MKPVGKPDAGNPHVRFDERGRETGLAFRLATAPFLDSTSLSQRPRPSPDWRKDPNAAPLSLLQSRKRIYGDIEKTVCLIHSVSGK